jgi:uncharacterized protein with von Willebrand factor type A (vWA) domain
VAAHLGALLAAADVGITPERCGRFAAALHLAHPATLGELYWLGRITLLTEWAQIAAWDRVFAQVFRGLVDVAEFRGQADVARRTGQPSQLPSRQAPPTDDLLAAHDGGAAPMMSAGPADGSDGGRETVLLAASLEERLRTKNFATLAPEELAQLRSLMERLAVVTPLRRTRRQVPGPHGSKVDLRATLRQARRTGGDPVIQQHRHCRPRPRRLVWLCDISGSMEPYARAYLQLLLSAVGGARAEAFVFATRLTRVTRALRTPNADLALQRAGQAAPDWAGGTRIGAAIKAFNDEHGRRGMARGAVVVILSDGWERGDPALLDEELRRLRRVAHRVLWVNPRRASDRYQPLTAGMAAAMPHLDAFLSGHSLAAIEEVLAAVAGDGR